VRHLTQLQDELQVNYCKLAVVSTDPPEISAAFRTGLGATFTFLSDYERKAIRQLDMAEVTPSDFKHGLLALPYTFSLAPDLTIHKIYNGWWFVGRPTNEELRQDLRELMSRRDDYTYPGPDLSTVEGR
jgi:peroxiredoxin